MLRVFLALTIMASSSMAFACAGAGARTTSSKTPMLNANTKATSDAEVKKSETALPSKGKT
jgi:hypothetical protein